MENIPSSKKQECFESKQNMKALLSKPPMPPSLQGKEAVIKVKN
jgi:hypothetical protein